jgi:hypothetical protein
LGQDRPETKEPSPSAQPRADRPLQPSAGGVGVLDVCRPDGHKDKIYYSTITPEEEAERNREEKEKTELSREILRNVIIDKRAK